jgi:hypothetical protein
MSKIDSIVDRYGFIGLYVLQSLEIRVSQSKSLRLEVDRIKIKQFVLDIKLNKPIKGIVSISKELAEQYVIDIISFAVSVGYVVIIKTKNKKYISFPHIKSTSEFKVLTSTRTKKEVDNKPKGIQELIEYIDSIRGDSLFSTTSVATDFYDYWEERGWRRKSGVIKDWKATVRRWLKGDYLLNKKSDILTFGGNFI